LTINLPVDIVRAMAPAIRSLLFGDEVDNPHAELLDRVFFALSDPVRRAILKRLGEQHCLVSELAAPFDISLQAVSRHVQVLVQAGLVQQERTGRIARCRLEIGAMFAAAVWINEYSRYWQAQFDTLAGWLKTFERRRGRASRGPARRRHPRRVGRTAGAPRDRGPAGRAEPPKGANRTR
jgi:DNA-binding transcriptional ArsR family regulator